MRDGVYDWTSGPYFGGRGLSLGSGIVPWYGYGPCHGHPFPRRVTNEYEYEYESPQRQFVRAAARSDGCERRESPGDRGGDELSGSATVAPTEAALG